MPRLPAHLRLFIELTLAVIAASACGSTSASMAAQPSPTLSSYDQELLTELQAVDFQMYETPVRIGAYVFDGAGLNYDRNTLELGYGGLIIDEWKAVDFNPASGKCSTADPQYSWSCALLVKSPRGHMLFAGPFGGLPGSPPDLGDVYVELGSTVINMKRAAGHAPTLAELQMFADGLKIATPAQVVSLNQKARDFALYLQKTAAQRIDFKTYVPQKPLQDFTLDGKGISNPTDPLHPYLTLHFGRVAKGNEAFEFTVDEYRDSVPLSASHCGIGSPELNGPYDRCTFSFTTHSGIAVFSTYDSTRFDRGSTRIVVWFSMQIDNVTQAEMSQFIDSFTEVSPSSIS